MSRASLSPFAAHLRALFSGQVESATIALRSATAPEDHAAIHQTLREHNEKQLKALIALYEIGRIEALITNKEAGRMVRSVEVQLPLRTLVNNEVLGLHYQPILTLATTLKPVSTPGGPYLCIVQARQVTLLKLIQLLAVDALGQADPNFFGETTGQATWRVEAGSVSLEISKLPADYVDSFNRCWPLGTNKVKP